MGFFFDLTNTLNSLSTELNVGYNAFILFFSILIFLKLFGYIGIFIYSALSSYCSKYTSFKNS